MSDVPAQQLRLQIAVLTEGLLAEFPQLPAGSVIRCFARAMSQLRAEGEPARTLPYVAERRARAVLLRRVALASGAEMAWEDVRQRSGEHDAAVRELEEEE